eukprot:g12201.t1
MTGSSPPVCESCKPGDETDERKKALDQLNCQAIYDVVAACMEAHRGNVADCQAEWKDFRSCHREHQKKSKKK